MKRLTDWDLIIRPGGWIRAADRAGEATLYLHLRGSGEGTPQRLNIHTVLMNSAKPISAHAWRYVPFSTIEQYAGSNREILLKEPDTDLPGLDEMERYFLDENGRPVGTTGTLATIWAGQQAEAGEAGDEPAPLQKPEGRISDDFLRDLATTYRWLVDNGRKAPASVIAEQTGAPVATVRRWISYARQRTFLPPGRPGRAG